MSDVDTCRAKLEGKRVVYCPSDGMQKLLPCTQCVSFCCLTSTEARRPVRDRDEWERGTEE